MAKCTGFANSLDSSCILNPRNPRRSKRQSSSEIQLSSSVLRFFRVLALLVGEGDLSLQAEIGAAQRMIRLHHLHRAGKPDLPVVERIDPSATSIPGESSVISPASD